MPSNILFKPLVVTPTSTPLANLLRELRTSLSQVAKHNLMKIYDAATGESEIIKYRVRSQWLVIEPGFARGKVPPIQSALEQSDYANFEVKLNAKLTDAAKLHEILDTIENYLEGYKDEEQFQEDVISGKITCFFANFSDSNVMAAMSQYKKIHAKLEATQTLLTEYFTKLIQANNDVVPKKITRLDFTNNWLPQDSLRIENINNTHHHVVASLGINVEVKEESPTSNFIR